MRITLKWKVAGGYAVLILALVLGLASYVERAVERRMTEQLRDDLAAECKLVRAVMERDGAGALSSEMAALGKATGARITIIAPDGKVLADTEADPRRMEPHNTRPEVVQARAEGVGWTRRHSMTLGEDLLYVAQCRGADQPTVRLAMTLADVARASAGLRHAIWVAACTAALLAMLGGLWLTGGVTRSLGDLAAVAQRIGAGDLTARAHVVAHDEAHDLGETLNRMADSLTATRRELEQSAGHMQAILAQMADGVIVVAPDETVQVLNRAAGVLLSVGPAEAVGRHLSEVVRHYDLLALLRRALRLRTPVRDDVSAGEDGVRTLAVVAAPVVNDHGDVTGVTMSLRDITELRRLEQVRRDFVANAGHELRTPVAAIRSLAETLHAGALQDPEAGARFLGQIVTNTENLARLLDDMMALAQLEATEEQPQPEALSVIRMLQEAASRLAPQADARHIAVSVEAAGDLSVWCAEQHLVAALVNLTDNAVKYTPEGGSAVLGAEAAGDQVRITVTDTGPGIPERDRQRVFERFYRVDKGRSRAMGGTGLGLSIVKHAVEASGGQVWVEAAPGGGARFVITLPAHASE